MIGLELVAGGLLHLAASGGCRAQKDPHILSHPVVRVVEYDYSKSRDQLKNFNIDTVSPYGPSHHAKIGGLMSGEIRVESRVRFIQEKYPAQGRGCLHIQSVDMIVHVDPTIYIAREYPKGTCQHDAIVEHEKKHVQTDVAVANKYADILKDKIGRYLRQRGHTFGPFPVEKMASSQQTIQNEISALVEQNNNEMTGERKRLQQNIDSLSEYERVSRQCQGGLDPAQVHKRVRTAPSRTFNQ